MNHEAHARAACARLDKMRTPRGPCTVGHALAGVVSLIAITAWSSTASAQGIALSRFEPAERGSRFFMADSLELRHSPAGIARPLFATGMAASYANQTRTFGTLREGERSQLVEHALYLHPGASVVIAPGARFALDLPVVAYQEGQPTNLAGTRYGAPTSPRFGDLRASFDLRLLGTSSRDVDGIALAAGVSGWLPTGSAANFAGDDAVRFGTHLVTAARYSILLASVRAEYMYRREGYLGGSRVGSEVNFVAAAGYSDRDWTVGPELRGSTVLDAAFAERVTPVELLLGAHRAFGSLRAGAALGTSVVSGFGAPYLRTVFSLEWVPAAAVDADDRDRDGVPDHLDACPDVVGASTGPAATRGCPAAPLDRDRDGIPDNEDTCPDVSGVATNILATHGCPPP